MSGSRHSPEDSLGFKLESLSKGAVFTLGIFPPQYSPSSPFSSRMVRLWRMTLRVKVSLLLAGVNKMLL